MTSMHYSQFASLLLFRNLNSGNSKIHRTEGAGYVLLTLKTAGPTRSPHKCLHGQGAATQSPHTAAGKGFNLSGGSYGTKESREPATPLQYCKGEAFPSFVAKSASPPPFLQCFGGARRVAEGITDSQTFRRTIATPR